MKSTDSEMRSHISQILGRSDAEKSVCDKKDTANLPPNQNAPN